MGKTIKLGSTDNTSWARSADNEGHLLGAYVDDNNKFNGIPLGLVRNSVATEVVDGVIKTVGANVPRFNDGKLLLEDTATQLFPYTDDPAALFSNAGVTIVDKLISRTTTAGCYGIENYTKSAAESQTFTSSFFVKKNDCNYIGVRLQGVYPAFFDIVFDIENGTVFKSREGVGFSNSSFSISESKYADGYWRISLTTTTDDRSIVGFYVSPNVDGVWVDGTDSSSTCSAYIDKFNLVQQDNLSSYIEGQNTRQADTGVQSLVDLSEQINSNEGVFSVTVKPNIYDGISKDIYLRSANNSENVLIRIQYPSNPTNVSIRFEMKKENTYKNVNVANLDFSNERELSIAWNSTGIYGYVDGVKVGENLFDASLTDLSKIIFSYNGTVHIFNGNCNNVTVYPSIAEANLPN